MDGGSACLVYGIAHSHIRKDKKKFFEICEQGTITLYLLQYVLLSPIKELPHGTGADYIVPFMGLGGIGNQTS
jgi:hypothetical protein